MPQDSDTLEWIIGIWLGISALLTLAVMVTIAIFVGVCKLMKLMVEEILFQVERRRYHRKRLETERT
jgi:uncharacterized metal-binding protein